MTSKIVFTDFQTTLKRADMHKNIQVFKYQFDWPEKL